MNARAFAAALVEGALVELDAERALINDLNVYPVPDGDTGTNLFLTMRAVRDELAATTATELTAVAAAVTRGSLMGARGNSGVILSQIVRGVCSVCRPGAALDAACLKEALDKGTAAAYRAVKKPVEGTMLTVIREMALAAERLPDDAALDDALLAVLASGRIAVEHTMRQLAALRQAGVVDAGGYGLLVIYRGVAEKLAHAEGQGSVEAQIKAEAAAARSFAPASHDEPAELSRYRYCTSFLLRGEQLPRDDLDEFLGQMSDSLLLVGDTAMLKAHLHTDDPGRALSHVIGFGSISEVEINDMHAQTRERDERLSGKHTEGTAVVAVVAGDGNRALFQELGCAAAVDGGQSMNPSAAQLLEAVDSLNAAEVIILPNNGNVILAAEQAAGISPRTIVVVPSKSMPAGLAAMVAFDPSRDAVANATAMEAAVKAGHSAEVTVAVRDSYVGDVEVRKDQVIGLIDGSLAAIGASVTEVFEALVDRLGQDHQPEFITVLTSLNGNAPTADELAEIVAHRCPQAELVVHDGGQPLYPILIGAE